MGPDPLPLHPVTVRVGVSVRRSIPPLRRKTIQPLRGGTQRHGRHTVQDGNGMQGQWVRTHKRDSQELRDVIHFLSREAISCLIYFGFPMNSGLASSRCCRTSRVAFPVWMTAGCYPGSFTPCAVAVAGEIAHLNTVPRRRSTTASCDGPIMAPGSASFTVWPWMRIYHQGCSSMQH